MIKPVQQSSPRVGPVLGVSSVRRHSLVRVRDICFAHRRLTYRPPSHEIRTIHDVTGETSLTTKTAENAQDPLYTPSTPPLHPLEPSYLSDAALSTISTMVQTPGNVMLERLKVAAVEAESARHKLKQRISTAEAAADSQSKHGRSARGSAASITVEDEQTATKGLEFEPRLQVGLQGATGGLQEVYRGSTGGTNTHLEGGFHWR
eukprot:1178973-Prorocentrum_minimum.AAC.1